MKKTWLLFAVTCLYGRGYGQQEHYADSVSYYFKKNNFNSAIFWSQKNVALNKNTLPSNDSAYGASLNDLALLYFKIARYPTAETLYLQSMAIRKKWGGQQHPEYAGSLLNMAELYQATGRYEAAKELLREAIIIYEKRPGKQSQLYVTAVNNLANAYVQTQNYTNADSLLAVSVAITEKQAGSASKEYAQSLNSAATLYFYMGNFTAAEILYKKALAIFKTYPETEILNYAGTLQNLARVYIQQYNYAVVAPLLAESGDIYKTTLGELHPLYAFHVATLADLHAATGNKTMAEQLYKASIAIFKNTNGTDNIDYANIILRFGAFLYAADNPVSALPLLTESRDLIQKITGPFNVSYADLTTMLASCYQRLKNDTLAGSLLVESLAIEKKMLLDKINFLSETELLAYVQSRQYNVRTYFFPFAFSFYSEPLYTALFNNHLLFTGVTVENMAGLSRQLQQSKDTAAVAVWKDYKANMQLLFKWETDTGLLVKSNRDSLRALTNNQEKGLLRNSAAFRNIREQLDVTFNEVRTHLKPGEAALEFIKVESTSLVPRDTVVYTCMLVLPEETEPLLAYPFGEKQLKAALKKFAWKAAPITRGNSAVIPAETSFTPDNTLFTLIWKRLEKHLTKTKTIYFSPDGLLNQVAFAAIPIGKDSLLSDKYNLIQVTSTRQVALIKASLNIAEKIALFGGINYNSQSANSTVKSATAVYDYGYGAQRNAVADSFVFLPGTLTEVNTIKKRMDSAGSKALVFSGRNATEARFRAICTGNSSPEIIHFATHGFTLPEPMLQTNSGNSNAFRNAGNPLLRCGLVLAGGNQGWKGKTRYTEDDGILTGLEISTASLQNTQLAVLSACETGTGKLEGNEGVFGLQRAFKLAGVEYVLAALWPVPDKETARFMDFFYKNLARGITIRQSFLNTQLMMRRIYSPYFWAGFTLIQ